MTLGNSLSGARKKSGLSQEEVAAVSYTHLDVYKRQVLNLFEVADIAGVVLIKLLVEFITCKNSFICIDRCV